MSSDGHFIAVADASGQVLLYGYLPHKGAYWKWDLVGKFMAHHSEWGTLWLCIHAGFVKSCLPSLSAIPRRALRLTALCHAWLSACVYAVQRLLWGCTLVRHQEVRKAVLRCKSRDAGSTPHSKYPQYVLARVQPSMQRTLHCIVKQPAGLLHPPS